MQQQKQNVLVPAKRKQMRPQRHLARKIKTNLRRSRQRTRKLPFAYRAYRKPNAPRSPSQNLLPRNPKPLRKDPAQALAALNDIPKPQHPGKQRAQHLPSRIALKSQNTSTNLRRRQRPAVKLPVRSQRQTIQNNDR